MPLTDAEYDSDVEQSPSFLADVLLKNQELLDDPACVHVRLIPKSYGLVDLGDAVVVLDESSPALYAVAFELLTDVDEPEAADLNHFTAPLEAHATATGRGRLTSLPSPTWDL